jgi:lysyl-tRNA synthetase class 2
VSEREKEARTERLAALRAEGVDPFPAHVGPRVPVDEVRARFEGMDTEALEAEAASLAVCGRIMAVRSFGKLVFLQLLENGAKLQLSAKKQQLSPELFAFVKALDVGDFVRAEGTVWRTRTDELTVDVEDITLLAKSLRPLPEKYHSLADVETRFRRRHLDLLVNEDARRIALLRSRAMTAMRAFLDGRGFLEVETPVLQPLYGGAAARPFVTHHNTYGQDLYLRISDELYLKRLVAGGLDRVYEIGHNFRNEGVSRKHNPEFTMMECYQAYADYTDMMELTEAMIREVAIAALGTPKFEYQGAEIDLSGEWRRVTLRDAILDATRVDILEHGDLESLRGAVSEAGHRPGDAPTWGTLIDDLFSDHVEPGLLQPTFITDYPLELSPLAKRSAEDPRLVERFEPFIGGMEVGNAFSELNDPDDQRVRLEAQRETTSRLSSTGSPPRGGSGSASIGS